MTELQCIALKCGTDKSGHGYCPFYEQMIGHFRNLPCTIIEIGIGGGESLKMWKEWMPKATVIGFDCNTYNDPNSEIKTYLGNQSNVDDLEAMVKEVGNFHIVVDDASHQAQDQLVSFSVLWGRLVFGGWYVIEDLDTNVSTVIDSLGHALRTGDVTQVHFFGEHSGSGILFLKKR